MKQKKCIKKNIVELNRTSLGICGVWALREDCGHLRGLGIEGGLREGDPNFFETINTIGVEKYIQSVLFKLI